MDCMGGEEGGRSWHGKARCRQQVVVSCLAERFRPMRLEDALGVESDALEPEMPIEI